MPPPTEQGFQRETRGGRGIPLASQCPLQQNKDSNDEYGVKVSVPDVAMPPPTEQGFQPLLRWPVPPVRPVAMPPPTEQGFQPRPSGRVGLALVAMPPPTEQGFQRHRCCRGDLLGRSQCLLQQNKDFNCSLSMIRYTREVAMPPPTEQGFQPDSHADRHIRLRSQCPLQQNKGFNIK